METSTFAELGLSAKVLEAITAAGYTTPTPIQIKAIPIAVTGRDILGVAQTGTGKTAAFVMPMISRLEVGRARARMPRSLILAPTRELAAQVAQSFEKYGKNHKLSVALLIGGVSMEDQTMKLDRGVDVLIATPGRLLDLFGRGRIMLMGVEILVIDEADRMLDMGFIPDIEKICKLLPPKRQTLFFSATMPAEITRLADQFLTAPERIEAARPATTAALITQRFVFCPDGDDHAKREVLRELIKSQQVKNAIIFCNRKKDVAILHKSLLKHGFNAGALHGDMDQSSRTATLDKFRAGEILLLAASDVAARGLDIPDVSHVFNFDVPWQGDDYVHRIGRTGRAGKEGFSATLVALDDIKAIQEIEKITKEAPVWLGDAPSAEDLAEGATRKRRRGKPVSSGGRRGAPSSGDRSSADRRPSRGQDSSRSRGREGAQARGREDAQARGREDAPARDREPMPAHAGEHAEAGVELREGRPEGRERSRNRRHRGSESRAASDQPRRERPAPVPQRDAPGLGDQPPTQAAPRRQDQSPNEPPAPRQDGPRQADRRPQSAVPRQEQPRHEPRKEAPRRDAARTDRPRHERDRGDGPRGDGPRVGFADNVPAFLRKPVRA